MRQTDLYRAVARATGESVEQIAHLGFGLLIVPAVRSPGRKARRRRSRNLAPARLGGAGRELRQALTTC